MEKIKKFIAGRGVGYYLSLLAVVCGILAGTMYMSTGVTPFNPELDTSALVCIWLAVAMCAVTIVFDFKDIRYIAAMIFLYGFMAYISLLCGGAAGGHSHQVASLGKGRAKFKGGRR